MTVLDRICITSASAEIFDENQQMLVLSSSPCGSTPPSKGVSGSSITFSSQAFCDIQNRVGSECPDHRYSLYFSFSNLHTEGDTCIITSLDSMS